MSISSEGFKVITELQDYSQLYKLIIVGDSNVGKTHLLQKFVKGNIPKNPIPTIGVEFATKTVVLTTGQRIKAQIWDTAGQQLYRSVTMSHYRKAVGAIVVYDISKQKSFKNVRTWIQNVRELCDPNVAIILVGNKTDLPDRVIRKEQGRALAQHYKILFEQTSVKDVSVSIVFERLIEQIKNKRVQQELLLNNVQLNEQNKEQKKCNC